MNAGVEIIIQHNWTFVIVVCFRQHFVSFHAACLSFLSSLFRSSFISFWLLCLAFTRANFGLFCFSLIGNSVSPFFLFLSFAGPGVSLLFWFWKDSFFLLLLCFCLFVKLFVTDQFWVVLYVANGRLDYFLCLSFTIIVDLRGRERERERAGCCCCLCCACVEIVFLHPWVPRCLLTLRRKGIWMWNQFGLIQCH